MHAFAIILCVAAVVYIVYSIASLFMLEANSDYEAHWNRFYRATGCMVGLISVIALLIVAGVGT